MTETEPHQEPPKVEEPKRKLLRLLSHPAVAILSLVSAIVGLIGLPLSFYFYYASKESPQLTYYAHPAKAAIVRVGEASRLSTTFDNKPIETDITAAQVAIWNEGGRAIKREQVLKPVVIFTENGAPILEATIRKSSREVTHLALNTEELQKGRVTVLWDILEQNDGGVIQLIYAGNPDVRISAEGVIEGQPQIERLEFAGRIKSPSEQYESARWNYRGLGTLLFVLGFLLSLSAWLVRRLKALRKEEFNEYLEAIESFIGHYDWMIKSETKTIATLEGYIADFEQKVLESEMIAAREKMDAAKLTEFPKQVIASYRKDQQKSRGIIEEYAQRREGKEAQKEAVIRLYRQREKRFDIAAIGIALLAFLAFIPAIYLLFIARPIGPPFGF